MLDHEELQRRLTTFQEPKWLESRITRLARWPGKKRSTLREVLRMRDRRYDDDTLEQRIEKITAYFAGLSDKARNDFWRGLFPKLAVHLERAWLDAGQRPYQFGYSRLPFRAPSHQATVDTCRSRFFILTCSALSGLNCDAEWLAAWAPHLRTDYRDNRIIGWLLAAALRGGGADADAVRSVLIDSINGEHEVGIMGHHAVVALLNSNDRSDWEVIGKLLLAAQRQEGLRQAILEAVDEANPAAFRYMLGVVLEHDLARFSATVRAFDVWLGLQWAAGSVKVVNAGVRRLVEYLDDEAGCQKAIQDGTPEDAYLALWVTAYSDAESALKAATSLLEEPDPERRFVGLYIIERLGLFPDVLPGVESRFLSGKEDDPRLQMAMLSFFARLKFTAVSDELFQKTAECFDRLPARKRTLDPIVWPWAQYSLDRRVAAMALHAMAMRSPEKMIPYVAALDTYQCVRVISELSGIQLKWLRQDRKKRKPRQLTAESRRLMLQLIGDARHEVHKAAFKALEPLPVEDDELEILLGLLHRTVATLRAPAIGRLAKLPDDRAVEIVEVLVSNSNSKKRAAGLELAAHLIETGRAAVRVRQSLRSLRETLSEPELAQAADRLLGEVETVTLDDCLGLVPAKSRSTLPVPRFKGVRIETDAARRCLQELADLFVQHGETEIEVTQESAKERVLLTSAGWRFPKPDAAKDIREEAEQRLPLCSVWLDWLDNRPESTADPDGLELVRAWTWVGRGPSYASHLPAAFRKDRAWDLHNGFERLVGWMVALNRPVGGAELLVQYVEDALVKASMTPEELKDAKSHAYLDDASTASCRLGIVGKHEMNFPWAWSAESKQRYCLCSMIAMERGLGGCERGPSLEHFVAAYDAKLLNEYDLIWLLLRPRKFDASWGPRFYFGPIREVTGLREAKVLSGRPALLAAARRMRDRMVEIELARGERPTPASLPSTEISHSGGADVLFKLVAALGRDKIVRQHEWGEPTRAYSLSRLMSVTAPTPDDTPEDFKKRFLASGMKSERLLEVVMFAPQWASHAEFALSLKGLADAAWWIHAHTKQQAYWRAPEFREIWAARISERTELEADDLEEGAVDVAWFRRIISIVGPDGWDELQRPAKYASSSGGHKRAELFASAMLGRVTSAELTTRITKKRHQDAVRALGLIPLPTKEREAKAETLARYKILQEFKRESRKFGSQRQASEGRAVDIGMQNLTRTAGYRDPQRLQWAMESEAVADLARGPVVVTAGETTVSLAITEAGDPELSVVKNGRALKSVPAKLTKQPDIAELRSRVTELRRQRSRMRLSLEQAMCRGDLFTVSELQEFTAHPMLRPMVERLVFIGTGDLIGYPQEGGRVLRDHQGRLEAIGKRDSVRIAHPVDLLNRGDWSAWQRECFAAERVQPFKQIFRETYPKTAAELDQSDFTRRYAGHQVNPRQAFGLLKQRQWIAAPEEGVRKTYHDEGIIAELWFQNPFYTPAQIEDLTLEGVAFLRRRSDRPERLPLSEVPDRLFSEAMRDMDLVVSVAHSGGVDPEASASTVEMRAALVRETCQLLRLPNVQVDGHHVRIDGKHASYSVHLGSATTKVTPGRILLIVAVHSQYRGRLFLPFADDDPKTAEVLSKTLLLARDEEIKDPSILEQIMH